MVATKYTLGATAAEGISRTGNSRKAMIRSVEGSLKRLKTNRIDLYWAHFADCMTPIEEIVRAFDDLVCSGKILYVGLSNFPARRIARADLLAELHGWAPVAGIQIEYSLTQRTADRELLLMAEAPVPATARFSGSSGDPSQKQIFAKGTWGGEWHPEFAPQPGHIIIKEHWGSSGFANTDLDFQLKQQGIVKVIAIGLLLNTCIECTSRFAMELGYHITLVKDATAAFSREMMYSAHELNGPTFAHAILTTTELVASLRHE